jgi:hypothetical protein
MTEEERIAHCNKLQWAAQQTQKPAYPAYAELGTLPVAPDRGKEPWAELRLTWVAGRLSGFESWIKGEAFWRGLEIQIDVDKGWIENQYRIKFDGPRTKITEMEKFLLAILDNGKAEK